MTSVSEEEEEGERAEEDEADAAEGATIGEELRTGIAEAPAPTPTRTAKAEEEEAEATTAEKVEDSDEQENEEDGATEDNDLALEERHPAFPFPPRGLLLRFRLASAASRRRRSRRF